MLAFHNKNYTQQYSKKTESSGVAAVFGGATMTTTKTQQYGQKQSEPIVGEFHRFDVNAQPYKDNPYAQARIFDSPQKSAAF